MGQNASNVANVANAFAQLSGQAATQANANRANIANANISAGEVQLDLQLQKERAQLSQAFSKHQGTLATNAAFRGGAFGDSDGIAALNSAALRATQESAISVANRAAQQAALVARNQFVEEDVTLASIEGGLRGLNIGLDISNTLQQASEIRQQTSTNTFGDGFSFGFENVIQDVAFTPGLDLSQLGNTFNFGFDF